MQKSISDTIIQRIVPPQLWRAIFALLFASVSTALSAEELAPHDVLPPSATMPMPQVSTGMSKFVGSLSCAAASCHGNPRRESVLSSAVYFYWDQDSHQQAGTVLRNRLSQEIASRLNLPSPAWKSQTCLVCHAPTAGSELSGQSFSAALAEGVNCESCHGPASQWLSAHRSSDWRRDDVWPIERKAQAGFRETKHLQSRASLCADCHVGNASQSVNHDLIAAGHPRLLYEFSAFQSLMPAHWRRSEDRRRTPTFEATSWLVGQLISAEHELDILSSAARNPAGSWPELSQYDCFGCHHDLKSPGWRQMRTTWDLRPGEFQWGTWSLGLIPALQQSLRSRQDVGSWPDLSEFAKSLRSLSSPREEIAQSIPILRGELLQTARRIASSPWTDEQFAEVRQALLSRSESLTNQGWDRSAQLYLAIVALEKGIADARGQRNRLLPTRHPPFLNLRELLSFQRTDRSDEPFGRRESPYLLERNWVEIREGFEGLRERDENSRTDGH